MVQQSDLPFGSEFSPSPVDLRELLEFAEKYGGDVAAFEGAVRERYFAENDTTERNRRKLANNTKLGMIAYGIIERDATLTEFGRSLYNRLEDERAVLDLLGRHILLNLNGAAFVQCILDMQVSGEDVQLVTLRKWLGEMGVHFPRGGKHPSIMRLWLEKAGVFTSGWRVNTQRFRELMGADPEEMEALLLLSVEQRAFLKTLANVQTPGPHLSNRIEEMAAATYGVQYNEKNLPKTVLYPLRDAGYIELERGTKEGRGAKPFLITPTAKLSAEIILPLLDQAEKLVGADLRPLLRKPMDEILQELQSENRHVAGLALEALAFKLMRLIDLDYVATRLRGTSTGGAEVDLIFESSRLVFSRWQVQCKNTRSVSLDDVAKEVGLAHLLGSDVIVIVSIGQIDQAAIQYGQIVAETMPVSFLFIACTDLRRVLHDPLYLLSMIANQCPCALCPRKPY